MNPATAPLLTQFDLHTRLFNNVTEGITDAESATRNSDHANNIKWIAGHLLNTRLTFFSNLAGQQPDSTFSEQFGQNKSLDQAKNYPPLEDITAQWEKASAEISAGLPHIPEAVLASPAPFPTGIEDKTMLGLFAFLISHEAYHIGQMGILRKMAGKEAMSYK